MAQALHIPSFFGLKRSRQDRESNRRQWSEVKSLQSPAWLKETYDRISELKNLDQNWDGNGGLPVTDSAIKSIRVLLSRLDIEDMPTPHVAPIPDGGIGLHWRVGSRDLEIEADPSGAVHYLHTIIGSEPLFGDASSLAEAQNALDWVLGQ
jgi:hypothetical protein